MRGACDRWSGVRGGRSRRGEVRGIIRPGQGTNLPSGVYLKQHERAYFRRGTEAAFYLHSKARAPMFRLHLTGCSDRIP
jgi:hypothetical protein